MSRRKDRGWSAFGLPSLRDRQLAAMWQRVGRDRAVLDQLRTIEHLPPEMASDAELWPQVIERLETEARDLKRADLFWVSRRMTEVAVSAAATLPEWTPLAALPAPRGLLCWERPAGVTVAHESGTELPFDAALWRPVDGQLHVHLLTRHDEAPLIGTRDVVIVDPTEPRREEADRLPSAIPELSVLASAWLLMAQPRIVETRPLASAEPRAGVRTGRGDQPTVSVIDVRPTLRAPRNGEPAGRRGRRPHTHQWWVSGHWRQQACGPGRRDRKPIWIDPYLKGPEGAPIADTVKAWRS